MDGRKLSTNHLIIYIRRFQQYDEKRKRKERKFNLYLIRDI